ncbi:hypothetical protein FALCPG4_009006 [Fusarium falciforme]
MSGKSFSQDDAWIQMLSAPLLQPPPPSHASHKATQLRQGQNVCRHADRQLPQCNLTFFFFSLPFSLPLSNALMTDLSAHAYPFASQMSPNPRCHLSLGGSSVGSVRNMVST